MEKAVNKTLPETPGAIVKTIFSFIGKSMLILFGILEVVGVVWGAFEQSIGGTSMWCRLSQNMSLFKTNGDGLYEDALCHLLE